MKKNILLTLIMLFAMNLMLCTLAFAQTSTTATADTTVQAPATTEPVTNDNQMATMGTMETLARKLVGGYLVQLFIDGGFVMWPMLILTIWGFAIVIWKLVALSYAKINLNHFLSAILPLIEQKKYKEAIEIAVKTRGPVATMVHSGLLKAEFGVEAIEKAIENAATIEMAYLEKGFIHVNTTINLAPMFGFFGTIVGMVDAFDAIAKAGEVDPTIVASGIKVALVTTEAGLAIAIPVQFFNNIMLTMVDGLVLDMQRASDKIIETIVDKK